MAGPKLTRAETAMKTPRLFVKGTILSYRRNRERQNTNQVLVRLDDVNKKEDTPFYVGKKIAYYYKAKTLKKGTKLRVVWGQIIAPHGNSGVVRAKFTTNLTGTALASPCRVFLFPSTI